MSVVKLNSFLVLLSSALLDVNIDKSNGGKWDISAVKLNSFRVLPSSALLLVNTDKSTGGRGRVISGGP